MVIPKESVTVDLHLSSTGVDRGLRLCFNQINYFIAYFLSSHAAEDPALHSSLCFKCRYKETRMWIKAHKHAQVCVSVSLKYCIYCAQFYSFVTDSKL